MRRIVSCAILLLLIVSLSMSAVAHPGRTDANGGHTDRSTGEYHYHHGYPAHQHTDIDGDGIPDCPYDNKQKTNDQTREKQSFAIKTPPSSSSSAVGRVQTQAKVSKPVAREEPDNEYGGVKLAVIALLGVVIVSLMLSKHGNNEAYRRSLRDTESKYREMYQKYKAASDELEQSKKDLIRATTNFQLAEAARSQASREARDALGKNRQLSDEVSEIQYDYDSACKESMELRIKLKSVEDARETASKAVQEVLKKNRQLSEKVASMQNEYNSIFVDWGKEKEKNRELSESLQNALSLLSRIGLVIGKETVEKAKKNSNPPIPENLRITSRGIPVIGNVTPMYPYGDFTVFMSDGSAVYHRDNMCSYSFKKAYHLYSIPASSRPCRKCNPPALPKETLWYSSMMDAAAKLDDGKGFDIK